MHGGPWVLARAGLEGLLDQLARAGELIGPVKVEGELVFEPVARAADLCHEYVNSMIPIKNHFLPTREPLAHYRLRDGSAALGAASGDGSPAPRVLFGARSCDVAGLAYLEKFLSGEVFGAAGTPDTPFMRRRDSITVLSVTCREPGPTCMCVCGHGGPALESGYDWQLTALPQGWLVESGRARGARMAARFASLLSPAPRAAVEEKEHRVAEAVRRFDARAPHRVPTMAASRVVSTGRLTEDFWAEVGERCHECGGCAFVCPTCYCFNVADLPAVGEGAAPTPGQGLVPLTPGVPAGPPRDGEWRRERLRDCCTLGGYVREAGGSYPRWSCGERCQTRFFHKLAWQFHQRMGTPGCTGCGRCVTTCMGSIGIDRVSDEMTRSLVGTGTPLTDALPRRRRVREAPWS
jgi:sulfhydrogenase subunit beta (sulfur reductase)